MRLRVLEVELTSLEMRKSEEKEEERESDSRRKREIAKEHVELETRK